MPRFRFPLEPLLTARRRAEEAHQRAVAAIERERLAMEESLRRQQRHLAEAKSDLRQRLTGTLDAHDLRLYAGAALQQLRLAQRLVVELAGVHKRLEAARAQLIEATRQRRAIELLRERRRAEYRARLERAEVAALDELAVIAAARKENGP